MLVLLALLAAALRREALGIGSIGDDYLQRAMLSGLYPGEGYAPFDLYAFIRPDPALHQRMLELGAAPWWSVVEGDPGAERGALAFALLRPLSSALLTLDHALMPEAVFAWHLHSLLWFVAAIVAVGVALRQIFTPSLATLATLLFALDPAPLISLAWIADRCVLVSACFGALALWAHLRRREAEPGPRSKRLLGAELGCVCLALAGGEYGVVAVAYLVGWELAGPPSEGESLRGRALALAPALVPTLLYLSVHQLAGYGIHGGAYVDPFDAPLEWLGQAAPRVLELTRGALWATAGQASAGESTLAWLSARAWPLALVALGMWRSAAGLSAGERRALRGLALGMLLGLLPLTSAPVQARLLVVTQLGACALLAAIPVGAARLLRARTPEPPPWSRRLSALPFALALLLAHTLVDLRAGQHALDSIEALEQGTLAAFAEGDLLDGGPESIAGREIVVVNALSLPIGVHGPYLLDAHGWPAPRSWRPLAMGPDAMTATRLGPRLLELSMVQGGAWLSTDYELNFRRADQPMAAGELYARPGLTVEIMEAVDGRPTRARFEFEAALEDPRYLFVTMTPEGLMRWTPPGVLEWAAISRARLPELEAGERVELPRP